MRSPQTVSDAEAPARDMTVSTSGKSWIILALLSLGVMIAFIDRMNISSVLASKSFDEGFHFSNIQRGWINSVFFWSYALFQIPLGRMVDKYGVKTPYTICFVLWCAASAAIGLTTTLAQLIILRLIIGAAEAVVVPASYRWIRDNFGESRNGTAVGLYMFGNKLGPAIGAPVAAWLIVDTGWRAMFLLTGLLGALWLIPWALLVKNDLPKGEASRAATRRAAAISLGSIMASPLVWGTMIICFCYNYFTFYCMTWMPAYLVQERGLSLESMGLYSFFSFAGIAIVALVSGWTADQLIARGRDPVIVRKAFVVAGFVLASTVVLGAYAHSLPMALFWNVASLSALGLTSANNLALCRLTLIPAPAVGTVTGVQQVATALAGIVAPILSGWLLHTSDGYTLPMQVIFGVLLIGAAACLLLLRPEWAPKMPDPRAST